MSAQTPPPAAPSSVALAEQPMTQAPVCGQQMPLATITQGARHFNACANCPGLYNCETANSCLYGN